MLVWILAGLAVAIVPFILVAVNAQRKYRPLFDDAHLVEVAELLARLRAEAAAEGVSSGISSHGLAISWDATRTEIALSHRDGKLHDAAAAFLVQFAAAVVAPPDGTELAFARAHGRYLLRLTLPPDADAAPVTVPAAADLPQLRAAAADRMRATRFDRA